MTPHRIAEVIVLAAPRVRVRGSFWRRAASAWGARCWWSEGDGARDIFCGQALI